MPSTSPHLVEVGEEPSVTVSFTYYTDSTRRDNLIHKMRGRIAELGVGLPAHKFDDALYLGAKVARSTARIAYRVAGRKVGQEFAMFARAENQ
jgi:hypothetical protein